MEALLFAVPFITTAIMFVVKKLAGLALFQNGATSKPFLRFVLVLVSLVGITATSALTGNEVDPDSVSSLVIMALETAAAAGVSHYLYRIMAWFREANE